VHRVARMDRPHPMTLPLEDMTNRHHDSAKVGFR
jgi:hypothetical protein